MASKPVHTSLGMPPILASFVRYLAIIENTWLTIHL